MTPQWAAWLATAGDELRASRVDNNSSCARCGMSFVIGYCPRFGEALVCSDCKRAFWTVSARSSKTARVGMAPR